MRSTALLPLLLASLLPCAAWAQSGEKVATVGFPTGGSKMDAAARAKIEEVATKVKAADGVTTFVLIGHSDIRGDAQKNKVLALRRAEAVRDRLVAMGIKSERIRVASMGESDPVALGNDTAAHGKNRRVEVYVDTEEDRQAARLMSDPTGPLAWVSWIHRRVESSPPAMSDWTAAVLNLPLDSLFRVRTRRASAGEVTFRSTDRLLLSEESLVVIHDKAKAQPDRRRRLADVTLDEGSLFARLAQDDDPVTVATPASEVEVLSRDTYVKYDPKKEANTVSVYQGRSKVSAQGESVKVNAGYGTRVKKGQRPEKPTRLPEAPRFTSEDPVRAAGPVQLTLEPLPAGSSAVVEIERADRPGKPIAMQETEASEVTLELPPGEYRARSRGIDSKGIVGKPGAPITIQVTEAVAATPPAPTPAELADVKVLVKRREAELRRGRSWTAMHVNLADAGGAPLRGVDVLVESYPVSRRAGTPESDRYQLEKNDQVHRGFKAVELGDGVYSFLWETKAANEPTVEIVRLRAGSWAQEIEVPVAQTEAEIVAEEEQTKYPFVLGIRGGASVVDGDAAPALGVDWGIRPTFGLFAFEAGLDVGYTSARPEGEESRIHAVPLTARGTLMLKPGWFRVYGGGAGGLALRTGNNDVSGTWRAFGGLGVELVDGFELWAEGGYSHVKVEGSQTERVQIGGPYGNLGLRILAF